MRSIKRIVIHCTATPQNVAVQSILDYWKNVNGWESPGYHYLIEADGEVHNLTPLDQIANGAKGYNHDSIHISYIGGEHGIDDRTNDQKMAMLALISTLKLKLYNVPIIGHRDLPGVTKACPSFEVSDWLAKIYQT